MVQTALNNFFPRKQHQPSSLHKYGPAELQSPTISQLFHFANISKYDTLKFGMIKIPFCMDTNMKN